MAKQPLIAPLIIFLCYLVTSHTQVLGQNQEFGVCYGFNGDNLPSPSNVVETCKQYGIANMRIFEPNTAMLDALRGSNFALTLGVRNEDIPTLASSPEAAEQWFTANVKPYIDTITIRFITVGNEVVPGQFSDGIVPAMQNLQNVINGLGIEGMRATTVVSSVVLAGTYPPSASTFSKAAMPYMTGIVKHLQAHQAPLLINVYPYFAYASNPKDLLLDYAQFTATEPVVHDGNLAYMSLFEAMFDGFVWAMEKVGVPDVDLVVSETGWPHAGNGDFTTVDHARTYNKNFLNHLLNHAGSPKRPLVYIEGFIFSMVDEDLKSAGVEQNFGMFTPNLQPNYNIFS